MRLINTHTLKFSEFYGSNIPKYAILSHTWGAEEVTYNEWLSLDERCLAKEGYEKIDGARKQAVEDGWDWLWVDTNCIDKSSSAELTEAINSMYQWYMCSQVCYAYLIDVPSHHSRREFRHSFSSSRWFTRGWTLQELLAPRRLIFYSKEWVAEGESSDLEISDMISKVTGIDITYLMRLSQISSASVAQRMSWLSRRQTTREEDSAYCMLGIFGINMPLLYGEGSRAFTRLQEEIIKTSHDHSLFCWTHARDTPLHWDSILAPSPKEFEHSGDYVPKELHESLTPYSMTNVGLSIRLPVIHTLTHPYVLLNAGLRNHRLSQRACLSMKYNSAYSAENSILLRHWFPDRPINLEPYRASHMRRHHFYVSARPSAPPSLSDFTVPLIKSPHVLIVMQPTNSRLFRGSQPVAFQNPENSGHEVSYIKCPFIETYPPDMLDRTRGILELPTFEGGSGQVNACVMFLSDDGGQEEGYWQDGDYQEHGYFLLFGCRSYADHRREWGCKIIIARASLGSKTPNDDKVMEHLLRRFVGVESSKRTRRCSRVSDGSLVLELGTSVPLGQDQSLQIATLRGPEQEPIKVDEGDEEASDADSNCGITGD